MEQIDSKDMGLGQDASGAPNRAYTDGRRLLQNLELDAGKAIPARPRGCTERA